VNPKSMSIKKANTEDIEVEPPNEVSEEFACAKPDPPEKGDDKKPKKENLRLRLFCENKQ
jgi:hypothetical protein